jgi:hypothetical protein
MEDKTKALVLECKRLSESCQYTSTSIYVWLKCLRWAKIFFTAVPLILGSLASWELLTSSDIQSTRNIVAIFAFLAGLLPSIYSALKFDERLEQYIHASGEFKNLEHRFRKLCLVDSQKAFEEFEDEFNLAMQRYEQLSNLSITTPEWCFRRAQKKVKSGDYVFNIDLKESKQ